MYRRRFSGGKVFVFDVADGRGEGLWDFKGTSTKGRADRHTAHTGRIGDGKVFVVKGAS